MANLNKVILIGRLTFDVEMKKFGDNSLAKLRLAINRYYKDREGNRVEKTCFVDVDVWGKQGENCEKYLKRGSHVAIDGRLQMDTWEDGDGKKKTMLKVVADNVQFLDPKREEDFDVEDAPF